MQFSTLFSLSVAALAMTSLLTEVQAAPVAAIKRSTPLLPKCDIACTMEYAPICAVSTKNGQHSNTFGNKCALSVFNCENPDNTFRAVSENACDGDAALEKRSTPLLPKCNIACTKEFAPICTVSTKNAQHSQTFNNKCLLNVFNCENPDNTFRAAPETACESNAAPEKRSTPLLPKCDIACTMEYAPICAVSTKNGQHSNTFGNKCMLSVFNCENPDNTFRAVSETACDGDAEVVAAVPEKRSTPLLPKCNIACTKEFAPICTVSTKNAQHSQTFNNKCLLNVFNCENPDNTFRAAPETACEPSPALEKRSTPLLPKCNIACTKEYAPICTVSTKNAQHSQTFNNKCLLNVFNCENPDNTFRTAPETACEPNPALEKRSTPLLPKCDIACTMEYAPICAVSTKNGQHSNTFSNKCMLSVFNCENPDNTFRAVSETACDGDADIAAAVPEKRSTPLLPKCNIACTKEYAPICTVSTKNAQHSQTFNNKCLLNVFNCENPDNTFRAAPETACEPNPALVKRSTPLLPKCNIACTKEFAPICTVSTKNAQHSQTFNNKCLLNVFNCENPDNTFRAAPETACEPNPALEKRSTPLLPKCNIACTKEFAPICTVSTKNAQHSQIFNSKCLLNVFNCENPDNTFRVAPQDVCSLV